MSGFTGPMRRFWTAAEAVETGSGWEILLDGRLVKTPAKAPLIVPCRPLGEAVAAEWGDVADRIDPARMPFTRAANTAIDRVTPQIDAVRAELCGYGASDLLCYRAPGPAALTRAEAEAWDPVLHWAAGALGARFVLVEGVMHAAQPEPTLAALRDALGRFDAWELTAMHELVSLSGSLLLALAVGQAQLGAADAWTLSRIDEDWQIAQWGEDEEAAELAAAKRADFLQAARLLALLRGPE